MENIKTFDEFVNEGDDKKFIKSNKEVEKHLNFLKKYLAETEQMHKDLINSSSKISYIGLGELERALHTAWDRLSDANRAAKQYVK